MSIVYAQQATPFIGAFVGTGTTGAITTNTGSTIVLACASTNTSLTFSDSKGNSFGTPQQLSYNGTFRTGYLAFVQNCVGGASHTFTVAGGGSDSIILHALELSAAALSGGADATTTPTSVGASPIAVQSITPVSINTLVLNFVAGGGGGAPVTSGGGAYTLIDSQNEASFGTSTALSYALLGSPAATHDTLTFSGGSPYAAFAIAFASASGGGGGASGSSSNHTKRTRSSLFLLNR